MHRRLNSTRHRSLCEPIAELNPSALLWDFLTVWRFDWGGMKIVTGSFGERASFHCGMKSASGLAPWRFIRTTGCRLSRHGRGMIQGRRPLPTRCRTAKIIRPIAMSWNRAAHPPGLSGSRDPFQTGHGSQALQFKCACLIRDHPDPTDEICLEITSRGAEKKRPETPGPQRPATSPEYNNRNCFLDF